MTNDLISRSALKEAIRKRLCISSLKYLTEQEKVIVEEIDNAPTVDIKGERIIRCIDCKYYHPFKHWCDCHGDWAGGEGGFCSLAERKEE